MFIPDSQIWCSLLTVISDAHCWQSYLKFIPDCHIWCSLLTVISEVHCWQSYLKFIPDHHIWCSLLTVISEVHCWQSYLKFIADSHIWCSFLTVISHSWQSYPKFKESSNKGISQQYKSHGKTLSIKQHQNWKPCLFTQSNFQEPLWPSTGSPVDYCSWPTLKRWNNALPVSKCQQDGYPPQPFWIHPWPWWHAQDQHQRGPSCCRWHWSRCHLPLPPAYVQNVSWSRDI